MRELNRAVYIMASKRNGTLYTGVTSNLEQRVWQHINGAFEGFSKEYGTKLLVWYESGEAIEGAIMRENQIKKWNRIWKLRLIESMNPDWRDLGDDILGSNQILPSEAQTSRSGSPPSRG